MTVINIHYNLFFENPNEKELLMTEHSCIKEYSRITIRNFSKCFHCKPYKYKKLTMTDYPIIHFRCNLILSGESDFFKRKE